MLTNEPYGDGPPLQSQYSPTETPNDLADKMVKIARILSNDLVLEPSAGSGNIVRAIKRVGADPVCVELNEYRCNLLMNEGFTVIHGDFLKQTPIRIYDAIVMCPPRNSVPHVSHACRFLKSSGRLVALLRQDSPGIAELPGTFVPLPHGMFIMDGKSVPCGILFIEA